MAGFDPVSDEWTSEESHVTVIGLNEYKINNYSYI